MLNRVMQPTRFRMRPLAVALTLLGTAGTSVGRAQDVRQSLMPLVMPTVGECVTAQRNSRSDSLMPGLRYLQFDVESQTEGRRTISIGLDSAGNIKGYTESSVIVNGTDSATSGVVAATLLADGTVRGVRHSVRTKRGEPQSESLKTARQWALDSQETGEVRRLANWVRARCAPKR